MTKPICPHCKGDNVGVSASAVWDPTIQDWVLKDTHHLGFCTDCDLDDLTLLYCNPEAEEIL